MLMDMFNHLHCLLNKSGFLSNGAWPHSLFFLVWEKLFWGKMGWVVCWKHHHPLVYREIRWHGMMTGCHSFLPFYREDISRHYSLLWLAYQDYCLAPSHFHKIEDDLLLAHYIDCKEGKTCNEIGVTAGFKANVITVTPFYQKYYTRRHLNYTREPGVGGIFPSHNLI